MYKVLRVLYRITEDVSTKYIAIKINIHVYICINAS